MNREEKGLKPTFERFWKYRYLLRYLIGRDLKVKYRRSILGILWSVLNPLMMMLIITAVFSNVFRFSIEHYPAYYLTGSVLFSFFADATNMSNLSILQASALIKKVYIPKYMFPLEKTMFCFVNMLFSLVAVLLIFLVTGTPLHWTALLFPVGLIYIFIFTLGVSLMISALSVYFRDMLHLYGVLVTALTYCTPIFYPMDVLSEKIAFIVRLNPLYHFVTYFRTVTLYGQVPTLGNNLLCFGLAAAMLAIGAAVFRKLQGNFILHI